MSKKRRMQKSNKSKSVLKNRLRELQKSSDPVDMENYQRNLSILLRAYYVGKYGADNVNFEGEGNAMGVWVNPEVDDRKPNTFDSPAPGVDNTGNHLCNTNLHSNVDVRLGAGQGARHMGRAIRIICWIHRTRCDAC